MSQSEVLILRPKTGRAILMLVAGLIIPVFLLVGPFVWRARHAHSSRRQRAAAP